MATALQPCGGWFGNANETGNILSNPEACVRKDPEKIDFPV